MDGTLCAIDFGLEVELRCSRGRDRVMALGGAAPLSARSLYVKRSGRVGKRRSENDTLTPKERLSLQPSQRLASVAVHLKAKDVVYMGLILCSIEKMLRFNEAESRRC